LRTNEGVQPPTIEACPPALALDRPERQRRWGGYLILAVLLWLVILCLPWLLARLGGAEREAGSPVPNPMGWI